MTRPSAPLTRPATPMTRPHAPVSTPTTTPSHGQSLKPSPSAMEQERWDEDSFHGLWDTNEDKGANMEYELCKQESMMPPPVSSPVKVPAVHTSVASAVPVSLPPVIPPVPKAPVIQQTVDYGHGRGECVCLTCSGELIVLLVSFYKNVPHKASCRCSAVDR